MTENIKIFVDGSFQETVASWAFVVLKNDKQIHEETGTTYRWLESRNVVAETTAVIRALEWCIKNNVQKVEICYDYNGLERWVTGVWTAKKEISQFYKQTVLNKMEQGNLEITWTKVKAHSGIENNEKVDSIAKKTGKDINYYRRKL